MKLVREAFGLLPGRARSLFLLGFLALVAAQAESMALLLVGLSVDGFTGSGQVHIHVGPVSLTTTTTQAALIAVTALAVAATLSTTFVWIQSTAVADVAREVRDRVVSAFSGASWEVQATQRAGRLTGLLKLASAAPDTYGALTGWIRAVSVVVVFLFTAVVVSPMVALGTAVLGFLVGAAVLPLRRRMRDLVRQVAHADLVMSQDLLETAESAVDMHVFRGWARAQKHLADTSRDLSARARKVRLYSSSIPLIYQYGGPLVVIVLLVGAPLLTPQVGVGQIAAVALLLLRVVQYAQQVQTNLQVLTYGVGTLTALESELVPLLQAPQTQDGVAIRGVREVSLERVGYSYPGAEQPALVGVDLILSAGRTVGIVGPSGGGKSTLAQILLGLRAPTHGRMLIDGRPLPDVGRDAWFSHVAHVPQGPRLVHGTIADNVSYGDPSISREETVAAAAQAGLHGFVTDLPQGYDTPIGPASRALSGGQVQRVALARALVRKPDVLVLDEPTSALDVESERVVQDALDRLGGTRDLLIVIIAHRLSTLTRCDDLVVLKAGRLVSAGPVDRVLADHPSLGRAFAAAASPQAV